MEISSRLDLLSFSEILSIIHNKNYISNLRIKYGSISWNASRFHSVYHLLCYLWVRDDEDRLCAGLLDNFPTQLDQIWTTLSSCVPDYCFRISLLDGTHYVLSICKFWVWGRPHDSA